MVTLDLLRGMGSFLVLCRRSRRIDAERVGGCGQVGYGYG
jgi:hypothetical protein